MNELSGGWSELADWAKKALKRAPPPTPEQEQMQAQIRSPPSSALKSPPPNRPPRPTNRSGAISPTSTMTTQQQQQQQPDDSHSHSDNIWKDESSTTNTPSSPSLPSSSHPSTASSRPPPPLKKIIRFRVIKLTKTGMYAEKVLALDPVANVLLFQDPASNYSTLQGSHTAAADGPTPNDLLNSRDHEKGFPMSVIKAFLPFDDAINSSAPMPSSGIAFTARLLVLFHPELMHRSYELLFQDAVQRNIFLAIVQELYGSGENAIEILQCDETLPNSSSTPTEKGVKWMKDGDVNQCMACNAAFTLMFRKHHCRSCGGIFCGPCSDQNASLPDLAYSKPVRVCQACFRLICDVRKQGLMIANSTSTNLATPLPSTNYTDDPASAFSPTAKRGSITSPDSPCDGIMRPVFLPPPLNRTTSSPITTHTQQLHQGSLQHQSSDGSNPSNASSATSAPTRDIYGFLLSSPTLALVAAVQPIREPTVLHVSPTNNGRTGSDDSAFTTSTGQPSDTGNSTLSPPPSTASPANSSNSASAAAAAALQASIHAQQQSRLAAQHVEFEAARARWNKYLVLHTTIDRNSIDLKRLVRRGIPPELRGQIWQILSGSREKQQQIQLAHAKKFQTQVAAQVAQSSHTIPPPNSNVPSRENIIQVNYYQHCLECSQNPANLSASVAEIDKDLHRTFPDNALFESPNKPTQTAASSTTPSTTSSSAPTTSAGLNMLRRVLLAYSFHNPDINYCQSMNFLTALLLLFMEEEDAFYLLIVILEDLCSVEVSTGRESRTNPGEYERMKLYYHSPDLAGAHIDSKVFLDLIMEKLPKVYTQFEKLSFPLAPLSMSWLLCIFVNTLPLETTLVLWDVLFSEGVKILFRASLTLLKIHEKAILKCTDFEELLMILKTCPAFHPSVVPNPLNPDAPPQLLPPQIDTAGFIKICFDPLWMGSFPMTRITALRNYHRLQVEMELEARKAKTRATKARMAAQAAASKTLATPLSPSHPSTTPSTHVTKSPNLNSSPTMKPAAPPLEASVQFALTSGGSPIDVGVDPRFVSRLDLFNSVTHGPVSSSGVIEGYYHPHPSPLSPNSENDYVAIIAPEHQNESPRMGKVTLDEPVDSNSSTNDHSAPISTSPPPAVSSPRPARPPKAESTKNALRRASLNLTQSQEAKSTSTTTTSTVDSPPKPTLSTTPNTPTRALPIQKGTPPTTSSTSSPPKPTSTDGTPGSPSILSSVLSSVGSALRQVSVLLSEDERKISERARRERELATQHHARARSAHGSHHHAASAGGKSMTPPKGVRTLPSTPPTRNYVLPPTSEPTTQSLKQLKRKGSLPPPTTSTIPNENTISTSASTPPIPIVKRTISDP